MNSWNTHRIALRKTSLIDYPGRISTVIFFPGCNLRCPWCYNRELVLGNIHYMQEGANTSKDDYISLGKALAHIKKRRKIVGGVVLSGGEPTMFSCLGELIQQIKLLGIKVKLDTNGLLPEVLKALFGAEETRPDYIAMDLKTSPDRYMELMPGNINSSNKDPDNPANAVKHSAALIRASGIAHEFRSLALPSGNAVLLQQSNTMQKPFFDENVIAVLSGLVGDSPWNINPFTPGNCIDPVWDNLQAK